MFARFAKRFEYKDPKLGKVTYPRGWAGELDETIHQLASDAGALVVDKSAQSTVVPVEDGISEKSAELIEAEKKVADLKAKVKAASDDQKQTIVDELKIALADVSRLKKS